MKEEQPYAAMEAAQLPAEAARRLAEGWRLVVITALQNAPGVEISYVFELKQAVEGLRLQLPAGAPSVPSITGSYPAAFIYENELQDLFGVTVVGLALDFNGNFYMKAKDKPFIRDLSPKQAAVSEAPRG